MPIQRTGGPVKRQSSKRQSNAVADLESVSKRVKTEDLGHDQLQPEVVSRENSVMANNDLNNVDNAIDTQVAEQSSDANQNLTESQQSRPATTTELLNGYLANRVKDLESALSKFVHRLQDDIMSTSKVKADEAPALPDGGPPAILAQWQDTYAEDKKLADFEKYKSWKVKTNEDAQHAVREIERCKTVRTTISRDLESYLDWQHDWLQDAEQHHQKIVKAIKTMFGDVIGPLQHHKMELEKSGRKLGDEISMYARRQSM
ncbi:hypothetical protein KCU78_g2760, partial [Aureobasidium melanogenum]